jgi:hypothetical protein
VYRGQNFLLPTIAPNLIEYGAPRAGDVSQDASVSERETASDASSDATDRSSDSAEDIIAELESSVGSLARSAAPEQPLGSDGAQIRPDAVVREQSMLVTRRGVITRTNGGAWMFVFDADAQGLADPPMILMPCLLLEHLEQRVWRSGTSIPVLISGRAYVFEDRNYLLPSAFQIAREKTPINES